jgi:hypothetical protein
MENPSSTVNTFVSATRNTFLIVSIAAFTAGFRNKNLRLALYCAICIMLLSIWNSVVSYKMFERYIAAASSEKIMAHPPVSWNRYLILIKAYTAIEVVVVMWSFTR